MKRLLPALCFLLLAAPCDAATKITGTTAVSSGLVVLTAETDVAGAAIVWTVFQVGGGELYEENQLYIDDAKSTVVFTGPAGQYSVKCLAISFDGKKTKIETARVTATIGSSPTPPPVPPQPPPDDPLVKAFQAAYDADPDPAKSANTQKLASLYTVAATGAGPGTVNDQSLGSYSALLAALHAGTLNLGIPATGILKVRAAVGAYLDPALGVGTTAGAAKPIDRALAAKELAKVGSALKSLKGGK